MASCIYGYGDCIQCGQCWRRKKPWDYWEGYWDENREDEER